MKRETLIINGQKVRITTDELKFANNNGLIESQNKFFCYYNLSDEESMVLGEIFKDTANKKLLFNTREDALKYAKSELVNIIKQQS